MRFTEFKICVVACNVVSCMCSRGVFTHQIFILYSDIRKIIEKRISHLLISYNRTRLHNCLNFGKNCLFWKQLYLHCNIQKTYILPLVFVLLLIFFSKFIHILRALSTRITSIWSFQSTVTIKISMDLRTFYFLLPIYW